MTANELAEWLRERSHDDVQVVNETTVTSMLNGKRRAFEFVPPVMSSGSVLDGDIERFGYWKRVQPANKKVRIGRLDDNGQPTGEWTDLTGVTIEMTPGQVIHRIIEEDERVVIDRDRSEP